MRTNRLALGDRQISEDMYLPMNDIRQEYRIPALAFNDQLYLVAKGHALDMAERVHQGGVSWRTVAENIVGSPTRTFGSRIQTGCHSVEEGRAILLTSADHRANILGDSEVGIGAAENPDRTAIVQVCIER